MTSQDARTPAAVDTTDREALASTLLTSWRHFGHWRRRLIIVTIGASIGALFEAAMIIVVAALADIVARQGQPHDADTLGPLATNSPTVLVSSGAVLVVMWMLIGVAVARSQATLIADYDARQRLRLVDAFTHATWESQSSAGRGQVIDLLTTHLNQSRAGAAAFTALFVSTAGLVALQLGAILVGGWQALAVTGVLGILGLALVPLGRWVRRAARGVAAASPPMADRLTETIDLAREIKSYNAAHGAVARVNDAVEPLRSAWKALLGAQNAGPVLVQGTLLIVILAALATIASAGTTGATAYLAVVLLLYRSSQYARNLHASVQALQVAEPFATRLDTEIDRLETDREQASSDHVPPTVAVRFDGVSFAYPGRSPILSDVTFAVHPGEILGLVGRSGAGKSTVIDLVLRLHRPTSGRILLDDVPIDDISLTAWRERVALVPQEGPLLNATVADNVRFFRPIHHDEVRSALEAAGILAEVEALPGGFDYLVGERGSRLSGGQRQRICIARALAGSPALLVMDEPTSALDPATEAAVRQTMERLRGSVTIVVAAHRPQTLAVCDRALEIVGGRVVEITDSPEQPAD